MASLREASIASHHGTLVRMEKMSSELQEAYQQIQLERQQSERTNHTNQRCEQQLAEARNCFTEHESQVTVRGNEQLRRYYAGQFEQTKAKFYEEMATKALHNRQYDVDSEVSRMEQNICNLAEGQLFNL